MLRTVALGRSQLADHNAARYSYAVITDFASRETELIWNGHFSRKLPPEIQRLIRRKLGMLDAAYRIEDLQLPPSNRLELLHGNRKGQYSIRVNDRWRICFVWLDGNCSAVEVVDYH